MTTTPDQDPSESVTGSPGNVGNPGSAGVGGSGGTGGTGGTGQRGKRGEQGAKGLVGETGKTGITGESGDPGEKGPPGDTGIRGLTGESGNNGEKGLTGTTGPRGWTGDVGEKGKDSYDPPTWQKIAVFITVIVCAASAYYWAKQGSDRLDKADQRLDQSTAARIELRREQRLFDSRQICQQTIITNTIAALRSRSSFAEQASEVALNLSVAQKKFLSTPASTDPKVREKAFADYVKALDFNIAAINDQLMVRVDHPYPTAQEIRACQR